jgi:hypothetical protein
MAGWVVRDCIPRRDNLGDACWADADDAAQAMAIRQIISRLRIRELACKDVMVVSCH